MQRLYVLYDRECDLCRRCRVWLDQQPAFVPLTFIPLQSPEAECRFPELGALHPERELVVIADTGDVWQGAAAWVTVLWALRAYREWAQRLASPLLLPLARRLCAEISMHRLDLSRWLGGPHGDARLRAYLADLREPACRAAAPALRP